MDTLIKADIFFFIASIATVILVILISILVLYLVKVTKNLYHLSEVLKNGLDESKEYAEELKERLENNLIFRILFPPSRQKKHSSTKNLKSRNESN